MRKLILMCLGLVIAVGFAFGCGSDDESTGAEADSAPLTKSEFIRQADAACAKIAEEREAEIASYEKQAEEDGEEVNLRVAVKEVLAPSLQRQAEELEALVPPVKDQAKVDQMAENLSKASRIIADEGVKGIPRSGVSQYETEAADYGMETCSSF